MRGDLYFFCKWSCNSILFPKTREKLFKDSACLPKFPSDLAKGPEDRPAAPASLPNASNDFPKRPDDRPNASEDPPIYRECFLKGWEERQNRVAGSFRLQLVLRACERANAWSLRLIPDFIQSLKKAIDLLNQASFFDILYL
jgi:hypothetical protein